MRTLDKLGKLIRAYVNDEESTRFTDTQINAIFNNSAKKILRMVPSVSMSLTPLREYVWWQFGDMSDISALNPSSHEFDFDEKIRSQNMELLSSNHLLHTFLVVKQAISSANVSEEDIVNRNVPHVAYWKGLEDETQAPSEDETYDSSGNVMTTGNQFLTFSAGDGVTEYHKKTIECTIMEVDDMDLRNEWDAKPTINRPISVLYNDKLFVYPRYIASSDTEHWMFAVEFIRSPTDVSISDTSRLEWASDVDNAIIYDVVGELYDIDGDNTRASVFKERGAMELAILSGIDA